MFQKSGKCSKLFVQDNCPILNCAKVRKALKEVGGELFPIPKRSGDLKSLSTRGPGSRDTCHLTNFSQTFTDN